MAAADSRIPVLIVGAGPTGLVLALWLTQRQIPVRIIDQMAGPGLTSRALAVQARTLEYYQQLGIADDLISVGVTAKQVTVRRLGKVAAIARLGAMGEGLTPFPYLLFCSQDLHEKLLVQKLEALGVRVERQTKLQSLNQDDAGVTATIAGPTGSLEQISAQYVAGCDGAHSTVRRELGVQFAGGTYDQVFFVADVRAQGEAASGGVQISVGRKDFCIVMPIRQLGSVRLTGVVPPEAEGKTQFSFEDVRKSVTRNTGLEVGAVNWFSTYHVHHRVASRFRVGRVFLAGDAGHIHSPAGGQGMNTGIGDAVNLAWKLADVLTGRSGPELLDTYEPERIAFARTLVSTTDTAFRFIASRSWIGSMFRMYLLPTLVSIAVRIPFVVRFIFKTISQIRIRYAGVGPRLAPSPGPGTLEWQQKIVNGKEMWIRPDGYIAGPVTEIPN